MVGPSGASFAPSSFGVFSGDLLIGNFGNGRVSAYKDLGGGKWVFKGQLRHGDQTIVTSGLAEGERVVIDGQYKLRLDSHVTVNQPPAPAVAQRDR